MPDVGLPTGEQRSSGAPAASDEIAARDLALADRYVALGFLRAARAVCERVAATKAAPALSRLAERALADGDGASAKAAAEALCAQDNTVGARLLRGRVQLFVRELAAARRTFAGVCESMPAPLLRARAHLGLCQVARAEGDHAGGGAQAMAAWDALIEAANAGTLDAGGLALAEIVSGHIIVSGRGEDAGAAVAETGSATVGLLRAVLAQASGQAIDDGAIDQSAWPPSLERAARELFARHHLRAANRGASPKTTAAVAELKQLEADLEATDLDAAAIAMLARVRLAMAGALEADPQSAEKAATLYRRVLDAQPANAGAANNLARLCLAAGDTEAAVKASARALAASPDSELCWLTFARALSLSSAAASEAHLRTVLEAAVPGLGTALAKAAARLHHATATVSRESVLAGVHTRGHRMKNAVGIIGARVRSARKLADEGHDPNLATRLDELAREVTSIYDEWARYLRSVEATPPAFEAISITALVDKVVAEIPAPSIPVSVTLPEGGVPEVRGDRLLLGEAIHNLVANAIDACKETGGRVNVGVRYLGSDAMPAVHIEIADTGPGIIAADLAQIFAPGFTTKPAGSGIGLAVVERVVTAHRGRLIVDSAAGKGTTMTIVLPCAGDPR